MMQYEHLLSVYEDIICVHGLAHFPGREGLWNLAQTHGWKWSVRNWASGSYDSFIYRWDAEHPFVDLDGKPLDI